jgi:hypothetical protein
VAGGNRTTSVALGLARRPLGQGGWSMDPRLEFVFYLGALICFGLAAAGGRVGPRTGNVGLLPLGLALWLFPLLWNTGVAAF